MATLLLIKPIDLKQRTVLGGNIDVDKINFMIDEVQRSTLEPLLGTELFEKILTDFDNNTLAGLYLDLYNKFVFYILLYQTAGEYIEVSSYTVDNGGIYRHQADNEDIPTRTDIEFFANRYRAKTDDYVERFYKWICKNPLDEYKTYQDEVNAQKDMKLMGGLYLGDVQDPNKWERYQGYSHNNNCNFKDDLNECCP